MLGDKQWTVLGAYNGCQVTLSYTVPVVKSEVARLLAAQPSQLFPILTLRISTVFRSSLKQCCGTECICVGVDHGFKNFWLPLKYYGFWDQPVD
jgi:hypothetical protein